MANGSTLERREMAHALLEHLKKMLADKYRK